MMHEVEAMQLMHAADACMQPMHACMQLLLAMQLMHVAEAMQSSGSVIKLSSDLV
jgi:hypothetical protein